MKRTAYILLFIFALPGHAAMYKWTDKEGNTHYGEQPPNRQQAQNIAAPPPPASSSAGSSKRIQSLREGILKQTEEGQKAKEAAQKKSAENQKMSDYCAQLRKRITAFQSRPRVRQKGEDGEYSYLGDQQKQKQQKEMQQRLAKDCS